MGDGSSIPGILEINFPENAGNATRTNNTGLAKSVFNPGIKEDYSPLPGPRDPSHPDFDGSFDNWENYFRQIIQTGKGRYLMLNIPRLGGIIRGRVYSPRSLEGEFIFETKERRYESIEYHEIEGISVKK